MTRVYSFHPTPVIHFQQKNQFQTKKCPESPYILSFASTLKKLNTHILSSKHAASSTIKINNKIVTYRHP